MNHLARARGHLFVPFSLTRQMTTYESMPQTPLFPLEECLGGERTPACGLLQAYYRLHSGSAVSYPRRFLA